MRRSAWPFLAASSVLITALACAAATRPHYGGVLRVQLRAAPVSLNPSTVGDAPQVVPLVFDRLTTFDSTGRLQPRLATTWEVDNESRRWQFRLRRGVKFQDGSLLTADSVAASLGAANPSWKLSAAGDSVVIEMETGDPTVAAQLSLPRNAIFRRNGDHVVGTGPFRVKDWQPGRKLVLEANDAYWGGRPFIDSVQIDLGQNLREQMIALELGRTDVIEVAPEQVRRVALDGGRIAESAALELVALVFTREAQSAEESRIRQAISESVDRGAMQRVLLQGRGAAAASILPNWMSGYAFLFSAERDLGRAQQLRSEAGARPSLTLGYDPSYPANQLLAERVALNAREAGIILQLSPSGNGDVRLVRIALNSPDPSVALAGVAAAVGTATPSFSGNSPDELYRRERDLLQTGRIIPLLHVPRSYALSPALSGWQQDWFGQWHLEDVSAGKP